MPNRILKESICTSDTLDTLTAEEERFFYRLLVQCDDFGRFDGRPSVVRARCYPLKLDSVSDADVSARLATLARVGLIQLYTVADHPYLQVVTWDDHQQRRASSSKYPDPPADVPCPPTTDSNGNHPQAADSVGEHMSPYSYSNANPDAQSHGRAHETQTTARSVRGSPTKAELSAGWPILAAWSEARGVKPKRASDDDVLAAERMVEREVDPAEIPRLIAWMGTSPFHGDPARLRSCERNWGKYLEERESDLCRCGKSGLAVVTRPLRPAVEHRWVESS